MHTHRILNDTGLPSPLPQRVVPYPDEDLLSLLRRSASRSWLLRPQGKTWNVMIDCIGGCNWSFVVRRIGYICSKSVLPVKPRLLQTANRHIPVPAANKRIARSIQHLLAQPTPYTSENACFSKHLGSRY